MANSVRSAASVRSVEAEAQIQYLCTKFMTDAQPAVSTERDIAEFYRGTEIEDEEIVWIVH